MKCSLLLALLMALNTSCVTVLADHTLRTQTESFPASGIEAAILKTGAGMLTVTGMPDLSAIDVRAEFKSRSGFSGNTQEILDNLQLDMEVRGNTFYLKADHRGGWNWGDSGCIDIYINMPANIELDVDDGSGPLSISGIDRNVGIKDGSGEIELTRINGSIRIHDGSGEIRVRNAQGNLEINDGSGSIDLRYLGGNVQIQDGSGSIHVDDVGGDLVISGDGSGEIRVRNIQHNVDIHDGSGSIDVLQVGGNVHIHDGSGSIRVEHTEGNVQIHDGSGSIDADHVGGDLIIPAAGSGSVHYSDIRGNASVPKR
jgi:hypothetical protein